MFKLVALDLDGTLLNSNHELSERSINTLRSLSRSGVIVGIATGRSIKNILKYLVALDLPQDYVPTVLYNGAYGFKFVRQGIEWKPEELFGFPLPLTQTDAVLSFAAKYGCVAQYYDGRTGDIYAAPTSEDHLSLLQRYEKLVGHKQCFISDYNDAKEKSLSAKVLIMTNDADKLIENAHIELADHQFSIIKGSPFPFFVEFLVSGITKGHGLRELCSILEISIDHVVAFGDGDNDAEMLEFAGHGIAMRNAKDAAKIKSNLVLEWTNDEDGVALKLEEMLAQNLFLTH